MKKIIYVLTLLVFVSFLGGCKKSGSLEFKFLRASGYFQWGDEEQNFYFIHKNVQNVVMTSVTEGWDADLYYSGSFVRVKPPKDPVDEKKRDELRYGTAKFTITGTKGEISYYTLSFQIIGDNYVDVTENKTNYSNSYVLTMPDALYTMDVSACPAGKINTDDIYDVEILWQSEAKLIQDIYFDHDKNEVSFFVNSKQEDGEPVLVDGIKIIKQGNAVIAAVDHSGDAIWSWHLWFVPEYKSPLKDFQILSNGKVFMNKNLGSFNSSSESEETILESYGLYYQWGRKDPFLRPRYYNCAFNYSESIRSAAGNSVYTWEEECSDECGTVEYATKNPMCFITNAAAVEEGGNGKADWMYTPNANLWSNTEKTIYDPCPKGWKVPAKGDFDVLTITAEEDSLPVDEMREKFGWNLSDGANKFFYLGGGFRTYYNGVLQNMNHKDDVYPYQPLPWEGYYWTAGTTGEGYSTCMYFDLTTTRLNNKFHLNYPSRRANAFQIRCVKIQ